MEISEAVSVVAVEPLLLRKPVSGVRSQRNQSKTLADVKLNVVGSADTPKNTRANVGRRIAASPLRVHYVALDSVEQDPATLARDAGEHILFDLSNKVAIKQSSAGLRALATASVFHEESQALATARRLEQAAVPDTRIFQFALVAPIALLELTGHDYRFLTKPNAVAAASEVRSSRTEAGDQKDPEVSRSGKQPQPAFLGMTTGNSVTVYRLVSDSPEIIDHTLLNVAA